MSIEVKNLTHIYNKGTPMAKVALKNVSFDIKDREFVGIIGHTGSGKSTLVQHLNALIELQEGEILINGKNYHDDKKKFKELRQKVGLVFQYPEHQLFEMTVYKDVAFGPTNMGFSENEIDLKVKAALKTVGIDEADFQKSPFDLSGGQKRRVAIAGVLAMSPEILILDEPTAGLDPKGRDEILSAIKYMHDSLGITVILISHSMEDIAKTVDKIIVMNSGEVAIIGTPREVFFQKDKLIKMGLGVPQVSLVMSELKNKGFDVNSDIFTVDEAADALYKILKVRL